jgi:hypothetical protein
MLKSINSQNDSISLILMRGNKGKHCLGFCLLSNRVKKRLRKQSLLNIVTYFVKKNV